MNISIYSRSQKLLKSPNFKGRINSTQNSKALKKGDDHISPFQSWHSMILCWQASQSVFQFSRHKRQKWKRIGWPCLWQVITTSLVHSNSSSYRWDPSLARFSHFISVVHDPGRIVESTGEHKKTTTRYPGPTLQRVVWSGPKKVEPGLRIITLYSKVKNATSNSQGQWARKYRGSL